MEKCACSSTDICWQRFLLHSCRSLTQWNTGKLHKKSIILLNIVSTLTNNTEAILESRLLQSKGPPNHPTKGRQGLQRGPNSVRDVTDCNIGSPIIYHNVRVKIIAGELHWRRRVAHMHFSMHFAVHPLRLSWKNTPKPSTLVTEENNQTSWQYPETCPTSWNSIQKLCE